MHASTLLSGGTPFGTTPAGSLKKNSIDFFPFVDVSLRNRTTCPMGCLEDLTNFIEIWPFCDSKGSQKVSFRFTIGELRQ